MAGAETRLTWSPETKFDHIPFAVFDGFNHGSIVERTTPGFADANGPGALALEALAVTDLAGYARAAARFAAVAEANYTRIQGDNRSRWQQFFFRVRDDVGQSVPDYFLDFFVVNARGRPDRDLTQAFDESFEAQFYTHSADTSHRVMMVNCDELRAFGARLAEKGARLVFDVDGGVAAARRELPPRGVRGVRRRGTRAGSDLVPLPEHDHARRGRARPRADVAHPRSPRSERRRAEAGPRDRAAPSPDGPRSSAATADPGTPMTRG